jgi:archaellum component FlaC
MTQRDFKIKNGLIFGGNVTSNTNGLIFDYVANTLTLAGSQVAIQPDLNNVQSNVTTLRSDFTQYAQTTTANVNSVSSNVSALQLQATANINTVQNNLTAAIATAASNDFITYSRLNANINVVSSNVSTLTTSVNTIRGNVNSVSSNVDTLSGNVTTRLNLVQSNLDTAVATAAANDFVTYTRLNANINAVSSNVSALTTSVNSIRGNVNSVADNVAAIINGTTPFTGTVTMQQDLVIGGNLSVSGQVTAINSTDTAIQDRVVTLSNGASSATFDSGLLISRGSDGNVFVGFDESLNEFVAAYTTNSGANTVTDYIIDAYANVHFNNIAVEGLVDGVDIAGLKQGVDGIQSNINSVTSNVTSLTTSVNTIRSNVNSVSSNVAAVISNVNTVSSNVDSLRTSVNTIRGNVNSVSDNVAAIINGTTPFTGPVTFQDNISADRAILNTQLHVGSNVTTGVSSISTPVFTFPGATFRGAELLMMVQDITNSEYQLSKILVVHNGNEVFTTEYGIIHTGTDDLTTFTASIDAADVITVASVGGSANKKITVASHYLIQ